MFAAFDARLPPTPRFAATVEQVEQKRSSWHQRSLSADITR